MTREGQTPQQERLGRLLELKDFRMLLAEWMDSGAAPWTGAVAPEEAHSVSYNNGRAAFVAQLSEEIREYFPRQYNMIQEEIWNERRTSGLAGQ